jgi:hypothetical protein
MRNCPKSSSDGSRRKPCEAESAFGLTATSGQIAIRNIACWRDLAERPFDLADGWVMASRWRSRQNKFQPRGFLAKKSKVLNLYPS